jgi:hypothetical protein
VPQYSSTKSRNRADGNHSVGLFALTPKYKMPNTQNQLPELQTPARGMLLHCGAERVTREQLFRTRTPKGTDTWFPLSHRTILGEVESQLKATGFRVTEEAHALSHEGARYFGVLSVSVPSRQNTDVQWVVGLRNSHDQTYPAGLVAGTRVLVCDNLAFSGEVRINRKHTKYAYRDLRHLTARAVGQLGEKLRGLDQRIASYQDSPVADHIAHDITIRAVDCGAITTGQIPEVLKEWRWPSHEAFLPRNAWSLFNAFTEAFKQVNPHTALRRGEALHGLFDAVAGLN